MRKTDGIYKILYILHRMMMGEKKVPTVQSYFALTLSDLPSEHQYQADHDACVFERVVCMVVCQKHLAISGWGRVVFIDRIRFNEIERTPLMFTMHLLCEAVDAELHE